MAGIDITIVQFSGQAHDTDKQVKADCEFVMSDLRPHGFCTTEFSRKGHRQLLLDAADLYGYWVQAGVGDSAVAWRNKYPMVAGGSPVVHPGGHDAYGAYGARTMDWATAAVGSETITLAGSHWLRPKTLARQQRHRLTTRAGLDLLDQHSQGLRLAFLLGDLNEDDRPGDHGRAASMFEHAGVTSIWDELGVYPATGPGGGTIDLVASVDADRRVSARTVSVHRGNTDHGIVEARYRVTGRSA